MKVTVLGGSGFIGSSLANYCRSVGIDCSVISRGMCSNAGDLGHVIDCVGITADFRTRPLDTVDAHVSFVSSFFRESRFQSFLYLSSTRLYRGATSTSEDATMSVDPRQSDDLYNISKLMGESICLSQVNPAVRVARLSNVYGPDFHSKNFLSSVIRDAVQTGEVHIASGKSAEKDYIFIDDVSKMLLAIATRGRHRIYNVASGYNVSNETIGKLLEAEIACRVSYAEGSARKFPQIDIGRIKDEFDFQPERFVERFSELAKSYREALI